MMTASLGRPPLWLVLGALALGLICGILSIRAMREAAAPVPSSVGTPVNQGKFEFAFGPNKAKALLESWGADSVTRLRKVIQLDFGFIPAYVLLLGGFCLLVARRAPAGTDHRLGTGVLLGAVVLMGVLDVLENAAMLAYLESASRTWAPLLAGIFTTPKWGLVGVVLVTNVKRLVRP